MELRFSAADEAFRCEARDWLADRLSGEFAAVRGRGGPGDEHQLFEERAAWERALGAAGWIGIGWPREYGGGGRSLTQQVIFFEEYARAQGPGRVGIVGEGLLGPTLIHFGSDDQRRRFLPGILAGTEIWCQGYSEPNAGSDLANVQTRAERDGDEWVVSGQKVWTSLAHWADWCFVLCRTDRDAPPHRGISYLLVPMRQPGVDIRPIAQLTGTSEFNEVFFDRARTDQANVVGAVDDGWKVAMGTLAFERGASTLGQQLSFENELADILGLAQKRGRGDDPNLRQRLADAWIRLRIMRFNALRSLTALERGEMTTLTSVHKLYWATLHRDLGELAMAVLGADGAVVDAGPYELAPSQRLFLYSRADTIYGGSNQIQRNVIGERALGLPREPR
ncbi:MAG TPA: acyl-CoA dehydrogenase family protein [Acidimicrobiia bacterium]|nr:acyl-CoA dehydrogenase family protein [Acidimicrobiia bacterium]